ncbi:TonB-dependent siderophore receptor [Oceanicoccus sp. KOV_DT_Chl]|uniref:TonB-dependent receptor plug domain-containing protein n=1 Tax=Oceanicoccus sp. KOV_DT_Chl TaxID=1904639 RepID=UPI000C7BC1E0|nr:TonB-dependent receptor [Oceanicoccus sp. KOV_DT_Chl]
MENLSAVMNNRFTKVIYLSTLLSGNVYSTADTSEDLLDLPLEALLQVKVASLFLEDEKYVGSSVSIISEQEWQRQGAEKTFEALEHLPGVYLSEHLNGMLVPSFRGYSAPNQYNSFLVLLDGMPLNNYSSASAVYGSPNYALGNLQSIELIRGPGSALYGADAFNGVVSLNSWGSEKDTAEFRSELGQYGYLQATARLKHSFNEQVTLTSALSYTEVDDLELEDNFHSSPSMLVEDEVSGEYSNITTTNKLAINNFEAAFYYSEHDVDDSFGSGDGGGFFPNGHHTNGLAKMKALKLSYQQPLNDDWTLDNTAYYIEDELLGAFGINNIGEPPVSPAFTWDSNDIRRGINVVAKNPLGNDSRQIVLGLNHDYMKTKHLLAALEGTQPTVDNKSREQTGVMGQIEERFLDNKFQVILGGRYDHYSDFGNHFSPRVALIYHPTQSSAVKFLYGEAFRAPAVNEQTDNAIVKGGGNKLNPEKVKTYELIWMHAANRWRYSVSTYLSKVSDTIDIIGSPTPGFFIEYSNYKDTESYGLELDGSYQHKRWLFSANMAYNSSKQTATNQFGADEVPDDNPAYPDIIASVGIKYDTGNNISYAINHLYQQGRRTPTTPSGNYINESLPYLSRTDFNMLIKPEFIDRDMQIFLNVRDIFDREDVKSAMNTRENGTATPGRRINVGFNLKFY